MITHTSALFDLLHISTFKRMVHGADGVKDSLKINKEIKSSGKLNTFVD